MEKDSSSSPSSCVTEVIHTYSMLLETQQEEIIDLLIYSDPKYGLRITEILYPKNMEYLLTLDT